MASADPDPDDPLGEARRLLIQLLENDQWQIVESAQRTGFPILRRLGIAIPSELALVDYILRQLRAGFPIREVPLGEPPGCLGMGYRMKNVDGQGLYIKLTIKEERIGRQEAWILSFHKSKHTRG